MSRKNQIKSVDEKPDKKRRHRLKKVALFTALFFILFLSILNGPIARVVIKTQINKYASKQGLSGDLIVKGTLWEGIKLADIDYVGTQGIKAIKVGEIVVDYDPLRVFYKEIKNVTIDDLQVLVDVDKFPKNTEGAVSKSNTPTDFVEVSRRIRGYIRPVNLSFTEFQVEVLKSGVPLAAVQWGEFEHLAGKDIYKLREFTAQNADLINTSAQDVELIWKDESLQLNRWEVLPQFTIESIELDWKDTINGAGILTLGDARLKASVERNLELELEQGSLTTALVQEALNLELPVEAEVSQFIMQVDDWSEPVGEWEATGELYIVSAKYGQYSLEDTSVQLLQEESEYFLQTKGVLDKTSVSITLDGIWTEPGDEKWWQYTEVDYTFDIPVLGDLPKLWIEKETKADYGKVSAKFSGEATLENLELQAAIVKGELANLELQGKVFPPLVVDANLVNELVKAKVIIEGDEPELHVEGEYSLEDNSYKGEVVIDTEGSGWANALLKLSGKDLELYSKLALEWKGSGDFKNHQGDLSVKSLTVNFPEVTSVDFKSTTVSYEYADELVKGAVVNGNGAIKVEGGYSLKDKSYDGKLKVDTDDPGFLNSLLKFSGKEIILEDVVKVTWEGGGKEEAHNGDLVVQNLILNYSEVPQVKIELDVDYDYPNFVNIRDLAIEEELWTVKSSLLWDGQKIDLPMLSVLREGEQVVDINGEAPYTLDVLSKEDFFAQIDSWDLNVATKSLSFDKVKEWAGLELPEDITGLVESDLKIGGNPSAPTLEGNANLLKVKGIGLEAPLNLNTSFNSVKDELEVNVVALEGSENRVVAAGKIPFSPLEWIREPNTVIEKFKNAPINAHGQVFSFPLAKVAAYLPELENIDGDLTVKGSFTGSINNPKYEIELKGNVPELNLAESSVRTVKNVKLKATMNEARVAKIDVAVTFSGSDVEIIGTTDLNDFKDPVFDLQLSGNHILVHRDDLLSMRANADLTLKGGLKDATLGGKMSVVESIVYKDIELIPIGVPSSSVANVQLPSLGGGNDSGELPVPDLLAEWQLDLTVETKDPILIRGNLARGKVEGEIKVEGPLRRPEPTGKLYVRNALAQLPFSKLNVEEGEIRFTPSTGVMNPRLRVPGTSKIAGYDVNILVHGKVDNPQTSLTSSPPLPESEIMALLGTGATTSSLQNRDAVALKAVQLLLIKLRNNEKIPVGNKLFGALLKGIEKLNLQVGEEDPFTGRKFTSASLDLTDKIFFTTQIDEEQQSRGLLIFQIRFK